MFSVRSSLRNPRKFTLFMHLLLLVDTWFFLLFCCNWIAISVDVLFKWRRIKEVWMYIYGIKFIVGSYKGRWRLSIIFVIRQNDRILNKQKDFHGTLDVAAYQHLILCRLCATFTLGYHYCNMSMVKETEKLGRGHETSCKQLNLSQMVV
jgi:hypothetical protein